MTGITTDNDSAAAPHRLRDLDRRGKLWAAAFALALILAPLQAYGHVVSDWVPTNDPALMGIQALEVGSDHTPLTGQPSTSAHYVGGDRHVDHLGPLHLYLLAVPMRVLGPAVGMLSVSVLIVSTCALLMAWALYRRLGPTGGIVGAALVGVVMFTTGAASLVGPVSSNMAGYPLYCSAVMLWCVLRGDIRLLPLAAAVTTFAAQQHLSVLPTLAVLVPAALVGLVWHWSRGDPSGYQAHDGGRDDLRRLMKRLRRRGEPSEAGLRRDFPALAQLLGWAGAAVVVGLVLWSPVLTQEARDDPGNLTNLVDLTRDDDRPTVGTGSAVNQVTNVLGLPPLLGRTDIGANSAPDLLLERPPWTTIVSAVAALVVLGLLWWHWRRRAPERQSLVTWAAVLLVAGLVNGSSVLDNSVENWRMVLYHWIWPLTLFVTLALVLGALEACRALASKLSASQVAGLTRAAATRPALASLALLAVAVPAAVNPTLDRPSNDLSMFRSSLQRRYIDETVQQVLAQDDLDEPVVVLSRGVEGFISAAEPLALYLRDVGIDVRLPARDNRYFVSDRRLACQDHGGPALLVVHDQDPDWLEIDRGTLVADVITVDDLDLDAYDAAVAALEAVDSLDFGPDIRQAFAHAPDEWVDAALEGTLGSTGLDPGTITMGEFTDRATLQLLDALASNPAEGLMDPELAGFLLEHPLRDPTLDPELLGQLRDIDLGDQPDNRPIRIRVYYLENHELIEDDLA